MTTLERRGLVLRPRHPDNGRLMLVRLSPRGTTLIEDVVPQFNRREQFAASALTDRQRVQLPRLLRMIIRTVESDTPAE